MVKAYWTHSDELQGNINGNANPAISHLIKRFWKSPAHTLDLLLFFSHDGITKNVRKGRRMRRKTKKNIYNIVNFAQMKEIEGNKKKKRDRLRHRWRRIDSAGANAARNKTWAHIEMPASIQHVCVVYSRWVVITAFLSYFLERCEEKGGIDDGSLRVDSMGKKR